MAVRPTLQPPSRPSAALLLLLFVLDLCCLSCVPISAEVALAYTILGPEPVSPGGVAALLASYNQSYVPWNSSYPTIRFGLSLSLLGTTDAGYDDMLAYLVDITNFRGGVRVNGVPHYVSVTYSVDDGSSILTRLIYADMFNSGNFTAYMAPESDAQLQALLPILPGSNATMVAGLLTDPVDFTSGYECLFSMLPSDDITYVSSLNAINTRAQEYVADGGVGSANGIDTVCLFWVNESLSLTRAEGVRQWIWSENARRNHTDNVTILVDSSWYDPGPGYDNYTVALSLCRDGVDLMVLVTSDSDKLDAALALEASQLRPKAVIGLIVLNQINVDDSSQLTIAAGWVLPVVEQFPPSSLYYMGGVFSAQTDTMAGNLVWRAGAGKADNTQFEYAYSYSVSLSVLYTALTIGNSTQPADMRAAILSLDGQTTELAGIQFDSDNVNVYNVPIVEQCSSNGTLIRGDSSVIQYPYNCQPNNPHAACDHSASNCWTHTRCVSCLPAVCWYRAMASAS